MQPDDEITSDVLDLLLDEAETLDASRPDGRTRVRLSVAIDAETMGELERRAAESGRDLSVVAADALRAGTRSC
ncbi:MAG: hypothetical protein ACSLFR_06850 [Solirubrobacteraceae bacterium]